MTEVLRRCRAALIDNSNNGPCTNAQFQEPELKLEVVRKCSTGDALPRGDRHAQQYNSIRRRVVS